MVFITPFDVSEHFIGTPESRADVARRVAAHMARKKYLYRYNQWVYQQQKFAVKRAATQEVVDCHVHSDVAIERKRRRVKQEQIGNEEARKLYSWDVHPCPRRVAALYCEAMYIEPRAGNHSFDNVEM